MLQLSLCIGSIAIVTFLLLGLDWVATLMVLVGVLLVTLSLVTMMALWGIELNALSLVNLVVVNIFLSFGRLASYFIARVGSIKTLGSLIVQEMSYIMSLP
ncbi:unnamed protein product [Protopolystoma xenopodis]|uniref:Uncharacterized protein n=1 Tax=Protopolystoma xenopodis TaxID=117903 RepID=A0A3S5C766_9PLAT|nr:unnamed protein product [Protopolystoma xenopodis]